MSKKGNQPEISSSHEIARQQKAFLQKLVEIQRKNQVVNKENSTAQKPNQQK